MKRWIAPILVVAGLSLVLLLWWRDQSAQQRIQNSRTAALSEDVHRLREDVNRRRHQNTPRVLYAEDGLIGSKSSPKSETSESPPRKLTEKREQLGQHETLRNFEARFKSEHVDRDWSRRMSAQIRDAFAKGVPNAEIVEANCASSLCRVVVEHESLAGQARLGTDLGWLEPFRAGVLYDYDTVANPPKTTVFVLREGTAPVVSRAPEQ